MPLKKNSLFCVQAKSRLIDLTSYDDLIHTMPSVCVYLFVCVHMYSKCNWPRCSSICETKASLVVGSSRHKERHWSILGAATSLGACDVCQTREEWGREWVSEWVSKRERGGKAACVWYTHLVTVQTNLACWGSDESWDLWRKESQGRRRKKKNT